LLRKEQAQQNRKVVSLFASCFFANTWAVGGTLSPFPVCNHGKQLLLLLGYVSVLRPSRREWGRNARAYDKK
jgi:hypothetical protein